MMRVTSSTAICGDTSRPVLSYSVSRQSTHLKRAIVDDVALDDVDVLAVCQFFGDLLLGSGLVTDKTDDYVAGVLGQLSQEAKLCLGR